ncbi:MAG: class I SAM-dependent methyltransferase [Pseudomonadota bacterium]
MTQPHPAVSPPSAWVTRWGLLLPAGSRVLDLAAGGGRHSRWLAGRGCRVEAVDRDPAALAALAQCPGVSTRVADLEGGPWPYEGAAFDGIVVTNYLHRPLFPRLRAALAPGGVLIYETFMLGNERYGRPSNPEFLLRPGELLELATGLQVVAYEAGRTAVPKVAVVQRLCAVRSGDPVELPGRA